MIRHGESEWNQKNLFCGWFDSDLSDAGRAEAEAAGKALKGKLFLCLFNRCELMGTKWYPLRRFRLNFGVTLRV